MDINRNGPCPCGSGKKYKKCCLLKENVTQLQQVKQERFYDQKHRMVVTMLDFLQSKLSFQEEHVLKDTFKKRLHTNKSADIITPFFKFWMLFFHEYENKLRGVQWFYKEKGIFLSAEEKEMALRWTTLVPKLIKAINQQEDGMIAQDLFSKETFFMPYSETLQTVRPWEISFCLLEPYNNGYYINGMSSWAAPKIAKDMMNEMNRLLSKSGKPYHQVVTEYYPELLSIILNNNGLGLSKNVEKPSRITQEKLIYSFKNKEKIIDYLFHHKSLVVDDWEENDGELIWVGDWYLYKDSELNDPIYLAESYGQLVIKGDELTVESTHAERVVEFENWLRPFSEDITLTKRDAKIHTIPISVYLEDYYVFFTENTPKYFSTFAQTRLKWMDLDKSIPQFNELSPKEMMEMGKWEEVELWLEQYEYNSFIVARNSEGPVAHTEDFNWFRNELGLPPSPFVTNHGTRETSIARTERPKDAIRILDRDIPYFKKLGFTPDTAYEFYGLDIVDFFKETIEGKSKGTISKYEKALRNLVIYFSIAKKEISSWGACTSLFWEQLISSGYPDSNFNPTDNQGKAFLSAINTFVKWLDNRYDSSHTKIVNQIMKRKKTVDFKTTTHL